MNQDQHVTFRNSLLEILKQARQGAHLTQAQVAQRLGRPQSYVSKYESGQRRLDLVELHELGAVLSMDLVQLVSSYLDAVNEG